MKVYCVMRGEARCDLDHVVFATTDKQSAEEFAMKYDFTNYFGEPSIEELDVIEEVKGDESDEDKGYKQGYADGFAECLELNT